MINICEMVISSEKLRRPDTYREVIPVPGEHNILQILPLEFARKLAPAASSRNILVHMYADIGLRKLYLHLQNDVNDLELFAECISKYPVSKYE